VNETATVAGGDIRPSRFVKVGASDFRILQAGAGEACIGVTRKGTRNPPQDGLNDGFLAKVGENCPIHRVGEVAPLQLGDTVTRGGRLKSDSSGRGVPAANNENAYAIALESGAVDNVVLVTVIYDTV
jgi:hypothetical protein